MSCSALNPFAIMLEDPCLLALRFLAPSLFLPLDLSGDLSDEWLESSPRRLLGVFRRVCWSCLSSDPLFCTSSIMPVQLRLSKLGFIDS